MDRFALFVDAGYLLAEAGKVCCGAKRRDQIECDHAGVIAALTSQAASWAGLPLRGGLLRTYWYDGAKDAVPTVAQAAIGAMPKVKLRLGRLSGRHQKGVDALIYRDLMTLARERAIVEAFLVAGDEDLREGVVAAQDMGVVVTLVGVPSSRGNQSPTLVREADAHIVLGVDFWSNYLKPRTTAQAAARPAFRPQAVPTAAGSPSPQAPAVPTAAGSPSPQAPAMSAAAGSPSPQAPTLPAAAGSPSAQVPPSSLPASSSGGLDLASVDRIGASFAASWIATAAKDDAEALLADAPRIPLDVDGPLMRQAESVLGFSLRGREDLRRTLRSGFWRSMRETRSR